MFEKQLGLRENPFLSGHQPKYVYPSREHQEALAHLRYGIQNREPFVLITGEVGTGKTTAVYDALAEWGARAVVALITNSALTRSELLEEICLRFGVAAPGPMSKPQTLVQLERLLSAVRGRGELAILLLDEAQNLDRDLLEEIRLLSNLEVQGEKLLQIFLVGQPELEAKLAQAELRQLRQRIAIHYRISPLSASETAHYIHHRVAVAGGNAHEMFPTDTCLEIFRVTNGIPREINIVAGQSLLNAFVEDGRTVTVEHVKSVEKEIEFQSVLQQSRPATVAPPRAAVPAPPAEAPPARAPEPMRAPEPVRPAAAEPAPAARPPQPAPAEVSMPAWFDEVMARQKAAEPAYVEPMEVEDTPPPPARRETPARRADDQPTEPARAPGLENVFQMPRVPTGARPPIEPVRREPEPARASAEPARRESEPPIPEEAPMREAMRFGPESSRAERPGVVPLPLDRGEKNIDFISPRLRAKLAEAPEPDEEETSRSAATPLFAIAGVLVVIALGVLLLMRFGPWAKKPAAPPAGTEAPVTATEPAVTPTAPPPPVTTAPAPVRPQTTKPTTTAAHAATKPTVKTVAATTPAVKTVAATTPGAKSASPAAAPKKTAAPPSPAPTTAATHPAGSAAVATTTPDAAAAKKPAVTSDRFGIAVGTYLNPDRANAERTSLSESTQLPARVVTVAEDSVAMYRVVMGSFTDKVSAERAASDLIRRGLVNEARVIALARTPSQ